LIINAQMYPRVAELARPHPHAGTALGLPHVTSRSHHKKKKRLAQSARVAMNSRTTPLAGVLGEESKTERGEHYPLSQKKFILFETTLVSKYNV